MHSVHEQTSDSQDDGGVGVMGVVFSCAPGTEPSPVVVGSGALVMLMTSSPMLKEVEPSSLLCQVTLSGTSGENCFK